GCAILGRTALDHVGNVDVATLQAHRRDHVVEKLPGAPHERLALLVLVGAWPFAHEHDLGIDIAHAENDVLATFVQTATSAVADVLANELQCRRFLPNHWEW